MCGARGQPHPSRAEQISVSAWRRIVADILGTHEEPRLAVESGALLGVTHPLQERSLKKRYPQRVSRFSKSAFGWRLGSSRSGYALQRRQAVVSQRGETSTLARWNLHARILSRSVAPVPWNLRWPFNRVWPIAGVARKNIRRRNPTPARRPHQECRVHTIWAHDIPTAKFARFRAFAMLGQSLYPFQD